MYRRRFTVLFEIVSQNATVYFAHTFYGRLLTCYFSQMKSVCSVGVKPNESKLKECVLRESGRASTDRTNSYDQSVLPYRTVSVEKLEKEQQTNLCMSTLKKPFDFNNRIATPSMRPVVL